MAHQRLLQNGPGMVISDVRFDNEAAWIPAHGGRIIHVIRPDTKAVEAHASEDGIEMRTCRRPAVQQWYSRGASTLREGTAPCLRLSPRTGSSGVCIVTSEDLRRENEQSLARWNR